MPRIYFNRQGQVRGYSARPMEVWVLGLLWVLLLPVIAIFYYFPRAVLRSSIPPGAKAGILISVYAVIGVGGLIAQRHTDAKAHTLGCINIADAPKYYVDPTGGNNNCPLGYEPGPNYPTTTTTNPPAPPVSSVNALCTPHGGLELGAGANPLYDEPNKDYFVFCNDGSMIEVAPGTGAPIGTSTTTTSANPNQESWPGSSTIVTGCSESSVSGTLTNTGNDVYTNFQIQVREDDSGSSEVGSGYVQVTNVGLGNTVNWNAPVSFANPAAGPVNCTVIDVVANY